MKVPSLLPLILWAHILPADDAKAAGRATARIADPRARQFWDPAALAARAFAPALRLRPGKRAWDVYLLFAPGVRWQDLHPPTPTFWMHQLRDLPLESRLDGKALAERVRRAFAALNPGTPIAPSVPSASVPGASPPPELPASSTASPR